MNKKSFQAKRVTHSYSIIVNEVPDKAFSLFTPDEEKKWAPGWDFIPLFPKDGHLEKDQMFLTSGHDYAQQKAIWIITDYKPSDYFVEYLRIEPDNKVGKIELVCSEAARNRTSVSVTYTYTSLGEEGNLFLETFTGDFFVEYISFWEKAINHYLETGEMISA